MSSSMINFDTLFLVFLIVGLVFIGIAVLLFFHDDVRGILNSKTGRGAKRAIRQMEEMNAQTGKLRQDVRDYTPSALNGEERISSPPTEKKANKPTSGSPAGNAGTVRTQPNPAPSTYRTPQQGSSETELLKDTSETELLYGSLDSGGGNATQPSKGRMTAASLSSGTTELGGVSSETVFLDNGLAPQSVVPPVSAGETEQMAPSKGYGETERITPSGNYGETERMTPSGAYGETERMAPSGGTSPNALPGKFVITKDIMLIHTDEVV